MSQIFLIKDQDSKVTLNSIFSDDGSILKKGYTSMTPIKIGEETLLFAYNKTTQKMDTFTLYDKDPWVKPKKSGISMPDNSWDTLDTFVLGNNPYLLTYQKDNGIFGIYQVANDLSLSEPYRLRLTRLTPTDGFTTVAPFTSLGQQYFLGYNFDTGTVTSFKIVVETTSEEGSLPLRALNIWYHQWAKNWTHFAFFKFGDSNFFFKINTGKLNVNIDHLQDDPAKGTIEVGSHLQKLMPNALSISNVTEIPWENDEPHILTYVGADGLTSIYRIHADCKGWTKLGESNTQKNSSIISSYRINNSYTLFYG
jgi:hypothetical protein